MSNKINKTKSVLMHLKAFGSISIWEAIKLYKATRLSAIIYNLRKSYNIETEIRRDSDNIPFAMYHYKGEKRMSTRGFSSEQEKHIAKVLNGKVTPNSGGTKYGGGDVVTNKFLIEAKTTTKPKTSFSIKIDWLSKVREQAFEQGKDFSALAFQFVTYGENYYIINEETMKYLVEVLEND